MASLATLESHMDIQALARRHAHTILGGTVLAVDPASGGTSEPGYALYRQGVMVGSGSIPLLKSGEIQHRLKLLYCALQRYMPVDVLVIERIRGPRAHEFLHWSVGVSVAAVASPVLIEMPVATWKALAGKHHVKSDENDAVAIGQALVTLAEGACGR